MKRFLFVYVLLISLPCFAESYRLLGENCLEVGNRWEYQMHITKWPGNGSVNWWGTAVREVLVNQNVSGYSTANVKQTISSPQTGTDWSKTNYFLDTSYLKEVRTENSELNYTLRSNNPLEDMPVWVNDSDNNRYLGNGYFTGEFKDPEYAGFTWNSYTNSYITFLRTETIIVPAGTFDCVVVGFYSITHDSIMGYDFWDSTDETLWFNQSIGIIKSTELYTAWDPVDRVESVIESTFELTGSNVTYQQDFNGDLEVNAEDFAIFASAWLAEPGDSEWNPDCDLASDNVINLLDFNVFTEGL